MSRYILSATAKKDLKDIKNYSAQFSLSTASRFLDAFEEKSRLLAQFPEMGSVAKNSRRRYAVRQWINM